MISDKLLIQQANVTVVCYSYFQLCCDSGIIRGFTSIKVTAITPNRQSYVQNKYKITREENNKVPSVYG